MRMTNEELAGFAVHLLTASGAAFGLLALMAAIEQAWSIMFLLLGVAFLVDGIDGPLARRFAVAHTLPRWSGEVLDLVVDFVTYVFVPAFAIAESGLLPAALAPLGAILIVVTGALYFADTRMKLADNSFRGFPALWNLAAFYFLLLTPPPWLTTILVVALAALSFANFAFIHPLRVMRGRNLNIALLAVWAVLALIALLNNMVPGFFVTAALCAIAIYLVGVGILRNDAVSRHS
jgi:phosphatidylcholine synthase